MGKIKTKTPTDRSNWISYDMDNDNEDSSEGIEIVDLGDIEYGSGADYPTFTEATEVSTEAIREKITEEQNGPPVKRYEYGFEHPDISQVSNKEEVYDKVLEEFSVQLKEWLYN